MRTKHKEFTAMIVGKLEAEEKQWRADAERKWRLCNEYFDYIAKFIPFFDRNEFKGNLYANFTDQFVQKFEGQFPPSLSVRKMFDLLEVDTAKIDFLVREIEAIKLEIDYNTGAPAETPDFNIYTKSEAENKLYAYLQKAADVIQEGEGFGIKVYPADVCRAFSGFLGFDFEQNKLVPNVSRVLNSERALY